MYKERIKKIDEFISSFELQVTKEQSERDTLVSIAEEKQEKIDGHNTIIKENELIQILLRNVSEHAKTTIKSEIEDIVSNALNVIYGGNHKFIMELVEKRNQHEVQYYLDDGFTTVQLKKPFSGKGGGKITMVGMALQLAVAEQEGIKGPIFLDEITKMVDSSAVENVAYFLKEYSKQCGRQLVLVTHHKALAAIADKGYNVTKVNGESKVKEV